MNIETIFANLLDINNNADKVSAFKNVVLANVADAEGIVVDYNEDSEFVKVSAVIEGELEEIYCVGATGMEGYDTIEIKGLVLNAINSII
jgi:hypothetical protein